MTATKKPRPRTPKTAVEPTRVTALSVSALAEAMNCKPAEVRQRLIACGAEPHGLIGEWGGRQIRVYPPRVIVMMCAHAMRRDDEDDPRATLARESARNQAARADINELEAARQAGELMYTEEARTQLARVVRVLTRELDTLTERLEQRCGLTPDQRSKAGALIDATRRQMHSAVNENEEDE